jgi:hypothetical protein
MTKYYVHYEFLAVAGPGVAGAPGRIQGMIAPIEAKSEREAIAKCKATRTGSFGHWVNRLANEAA